MVSVCANYSWARKRPGSPRSLLWSALFVATACGSTPSGADGGDASVPVEDGGADTNTGDGGGAPATHRVFVINGTSVGASALVGWDDAHTLSENRFPDVALNAGLVAPLSVATVGNRLYVFDDATSRLIAFDDPANINTTSSPSVVIGAGAFGGVPHVERLVWSNPNDILVTVDSQSTAVQMFANASMLGGAALATAHFGGAQDHFASAARDSADRLFVGDTVQNTVRYTTAASTRLGGVTFSTSLGGMCVPRSMAIEGARLYVGCTILGGVGGIQIYDLSSILPGVMPVATIQLGGTDGGIGFFGSVVDIDVANDVLVASLVGASGHLLLAFSKAKDLVSGAVPVTVSSTMAAARLRLSRQSGLLYAVGSNEGHPALQIWKDASGTPSLQAEIRSNIKNPTGIALYEP